MTAPIFDAEPSSRAAAATAASAPPERHRQRFFTQVLAVQLRLWLLGTAIVFIAGVALVAEADGVVHDAQAIVARVALAVVGGWGIARGLGKRPDPPIQRGWLISALLLVVFLLPLARVAFVSWLPPMFALGNAERIMLAPALIAAVVGLGRGLSLHLGVLRIAAVLVAATSLFAEDTTFGQLSDGTVSAATTTQLRSARDEGSVVLVRGRGYAERGALRGLRPSQAPRSCRAIRLADTRHGLIGLPGRSLDVTFDACWTRRNEPLSLAVITVQDTGDQPDSLHPVRLNAGGAFGYLDGQFDDDPTMVGRVNPARRSEGKTKDERVPLMARYRDRPSDLSDGLDYDDRGMTVRDERGRPFTDAEFSSDFVLARVREEGDRIEVVFALESADLFFRRRDHLDSGAEQRQAGIVPQRGVALDVVTASLGRSGRSTAQLTRITTSGSERGPVVSD